MCGTCVWCVRVSMRDRVYLCQCVVCTYTYVYERVWCIRRWYVHVYFCKCVGKTESKPVLRLLSSTRTTSLRQVGVVLRPKRRCVGRNGRLPPGT